MTSRPFDNVYMTQPLAGGPERAVHRKDIMSATTSLHYIERERKRERERERERERAKGF